MYLQLISILYISFHLTLSEYITPIGDNTCEGYVREDSTYIEEHKVLVKEKYYEACWSLSDVFRCTKYKDVYETRLEKVKGPVQQKRIVCCHGYKQIGDRCYFDEENSRSSILKTVVVIVLVVCTVLLLIAFIIPTLLYVREKRRRIHLEDLEHDPDTFSTANMRNNNNNIYTLAVTASSPVHGGGIEESLYETIDENLDQPPAYDSCCIDRNLQVVSFSRLPPPYAAAAAKNEPAVAFNDTSYDKLNFGNMVNNDLSYSSKPNAPHSSRVKCPESYSKIPLSYNSTKSRDHSKHP